MERHRPCAMNLLLGVFGDNDRGVVFFFVLVFASFLVGAATAGLGTVGGDEDGLAHRSFGFGGGFEGEIEGGGFASLNFDLQCLGLAPLLVPSFDFVFAIRNLFDCVNTGFAADGVER